MNLKECGYCKTKKEAGVMPNNLFLYRQQANISQDKLAEAVDLTGCTVYVGKYDLCRYSYGNRKPFVKGEIIKKVPEDQLLATLRWELENWNK